MWAQGLFAKNLAVSDLFLTRFWPVSDLFLTTLCVSTPCVSTLCVSTLYVTTLCEPHVWWARCVGTLCVSTLCEHEHRKVRELPGKRDISSWAGCCRTPKSTRITTQTRHQFLGRMLRNHRKVRKLPRKLDFSSWAGCCSAKNVKKARVLL